MVMQTIQIRLTDKLVEKLEGFVKEGVGAGGAMISAILKTGITSEKLLEKIEEEYQRIITSQ